MYFLEHTKAVGLERIAEASAGFPRVKGEPICNSTGRNDSFPLTNTSHNLINPSKRKDLPATSDIRTKLQGRPPCLDNLEIKSILEHMQANMAEPAETTEHNGEALETTKVPEILTPEAESDDEVLNLSQVGIINLEDDNLINLYTSTPHKLTRSVSEHGGALNSKPLSPKGSMLRGRLSNPAFSTDQCMIIHDRLSASTPNEEKTQISAMLPSDSDSSDEETLKASPKSFYLLRRLSHSLDHMIELEQAGIHSSDLNAVRQLNDIMEHEALPSVEIERFLTTAESFTCHSMCSCDECLLLKEKQAAAGSSTPDLESPDCEVQIIAKELESPDYTVQNMSEEFKSLDYGVKIIADQLESSDGAVKKMPDELESPDCAVPIKPDTLACPTVETIPDRFTNTDGIISCNSIAPVTSIEDEYSNNNILPPANETSCSPTM